MVISRSITRNLRSTVFSLHRQELMAVTTLLPVYKQWGYYTAAVGAIYTDVTTPVSFSKCFIAESTDTLLAASTTWPGTTQTVWNINASNGSKIRFIWSKPPVELDGAVWFGIFI